VATAVRAKVWLPTVAVLSIRVGVTAATRT
jgi:hypothetical protein